MSTRQAILNTGPNSQELENAARAVNALKEIDPGILDAIIVRKLIPDVMSGLREAIDLSHQVIAPVVPGKPIAPPLMRAIGILARINTELCVLRGEMDDPVKNPHFIKMDHAIHLSRQALAPKIPDLPHNLQCKWTSRFPENEVAHQFPQKTMSLPGIEPVPEGRVIVGKFDYDEEIVRGVVKSDSNITWTLSFFAKRLFAAKDLYQTLDIENLVGGICSIEESGWNTMENCDGWARDYIESENELINHLYVYPWDENKPAFVKNIIIGFEEESDQIISACLDFRDIMPQEPGDSPEP